ncbi:MAG: ATP-binding protein [Chloroflexota bacterium]
MTSTRKATYSSDYANLESIRDLVAQAAREAGMDEAETYHVQLAADEAASNIIEHAYEGRADGQFELECEVEGNKVTIVLHDHGKVFDITRVRKPNVKGKLSEREIGGLGVYLIQKLMDEVYFESSAESGNTLTMVKRGKRGS